MRQVAIICNQFSGSGKPLKCLPGLIRFLDQHKIEWKVIQETFNGDINSFSKLIILGGDGTLNFTLNRFQQIDIPILIIPLGTGNDFAKMVYGKRSLADYFKLILSPESIKVDAGICNGRIFINGLGIGFDGAIAGMLMKQKLIKGAGAYMLAVISRVLFFKPFSAHVFNTLNSTRQQFLMICIANGRTYGGGFKVAPKAVLNDGYFDIVTVDAIRVLKRLYYLPIIKNGKHLHLPVVNHSYSSRIHIEAEKPLPAHLDGEYFESEKFEVELHANKYWFVVG